LSDSLSPKLKSALSKALEQSEPVRLIKSGQIGLFPGGKKIPKDTTAAIEQCRSEELLAFTNVELKVRGKTTTVEHVAITQAGVTRLLKSVDAAEGQALLQASSATHRPIVEAAYLDALQAELTKVREQSVSAFERETSLFDQAKKLLEDQLSATLSTRDRLQQAAIEIDKQIKSLRPPKITTGTTDGGSEQPPGATSTNLDTAEQLVFAWKDATTDEAKQLLEQVMFNIRIEQLGERGERIPFEPTTQEIDVVVERGELVEVIEPGWRLATERGVSLLSRTQVRKIEAQ